MELLIVCIAACVASALTLFSGFGLGTILMPVVAIFFPVPVAVAITAIVHLLNNLFKLGMLWRNVDGGVLLRFGLPALLASVPGALLLGYLSHLAPITEYAMQGNVFTITPLKLAVGLLLILFATAELFPVKDKSPVKPWFLPVGGVLSGFFGGLSGHQGAFRSAFLLKANLGKEAFVSTNAAIAALVDAFRIIVYGLTFNFALISPQATLIILSTLAAFAGVYIGAKLVKKVTITFIQRLVAGMLYLLGILLVGGII